MRIHKIALRAINALAEDCLKELVRYPSTHIAAEFLLHHAREEGCTDEEFRHKLADLYDAAYDSVLSHIADVEHELRGVHDSEPGRKTLIHRRAILEDIRRSVGELHGYRHPRRLDQPARQPAAASA